MIYCEKNPTQVSFYVGDQAKSTAKLFHIRYKNRTSYQGDIGANARFNLNDVVKLELKIMPEVGQAFKEVSGWAPGQQMSFSNGRLQLARKNILINYLNNLKAEIIEIFLPMFMVLLKTK